MLLKGRRYQFHRDVLGHRAGDDAGAARAAATADPLMVKTFQCQFVATNINVQASSTPGVELRQGLRHSPSRRRARRRHPRCGRHPAGMDVRPAQSTPPSAGDRAFSEHGVRRGDVVLDPLAAGSSTCCRSWPDCGSARRCCHAPSNYAEGHRAAHARARPGLIVCDRAEPSRPDAAAAARPAMTIPTPRSRPTGRAAVRRARRRSIPRSCCSRRAHRSAEARDARAALGRRAGAAGSALGGRAARRADVVHRRAGVVEGDPELVPRALAVRRGALLQDARFDPRSGWRPSARRASTCSAWRRRSTG